MRTIDIKESEFILSGKKKHFICLGNEIIPELEDIYLKKIENKDGNVSFLPGLWGTLGYANDSEIDWTGNLDFSGQGNKDRFGSTVREQQVLIADAYPDIKPEEITERFISFKNVQIKAHENYKNNDFNLNDLPELRLTLMLKQDEGALVFYQFRKDDETETSEIRYIQSDPTGGKRKNKYNTDKRDRLTYKFRLLPPFLLEEDEENKRVIVTDKTNTEDFIIKILTFKRGKSKDSEEVIEKAIDNLNKKFNEFLEKERNLLLFNPEHNRFKKIVPDKIIVDAKTLLLIHGTFGTTQKSFGDLVESGWLRKRHIVFGGIYKQIIAYDHPTIFADAKSNIDALHEMLGDITFTENVDIIGTSQGGLLAQYLANINTGIKIPVGKIALVASANGIDYLTTASHIPTFLKVLGKLAKNSGHIYASLACLIAQHSADFFINMPGLKLMNPEKTVLKDIINIAPQEQKPIYLPIIDDYNNTWRNETLGGLVWRSTLDFMTWIVMGKFNDWVVKTENQYLIHKEFCYIEDYKATVFESLMITAVHGKCFTTREARVLLRIFFEEDTTRKTMREIRDIIENLK